VKLPGSADAVVEVAKLRDYCLNPHHPRGRHKARVFLATLELTQADAEFLRGALIQAAREGEAVAHGSDKYGERFTVDFELSRGDHRANIRSSWILLRGEVALQLTSCFVL
jgi:hypothetical protein